MTRMRRYTATQNHTLRVLRDAPWDDIDGLKISESAMAVYRNCKIQEEKDFLDRMTELAISTQVGKKDPVELLSLITSAKLPYQFYDEAREATAILNRAKNDGLYRIDITPLIKKLIKHSGKARLAMLQNEVDMHRYERCIRDNLEAAGYMVTDSMSLTDIMKVGPTIPMDIHAGAHLLIEVTDRADPANHIRDISNITSGDKYMVTISKAYQNAELKTFVLAPGQEFGKYLSEKP